MQSRKRDRQTDRPDRERGNNIPVFVFSFISMYILPFTAIIHANGERTKGGLKLPVNLCSCDP